MGDNARCASICATMRGALPYARQCAVRFHMRDNARCAFPRALRSTATPLSPPPRHSHFCLNVFIPVPAQSSLHFRLQINAGRVYCTQPGSSTVIPRATEPAGRSRTVVFILQRQDLQFSCLSCLHLRDAAELSVSVWLAPTCTIGCPISHLNFSSHTALHVSGDTNDPRPTPCSDNLERSPQPPRAFGTVNLPLNLLLNPPAGSARASPATLPSPERHPERDLCS
jgi:hypothetical protein